jgi:N-acetyl sugar amidotransferase
MNLDRPYQQCVRCVMDTSDLEIEFDENGICNHCKGYDKIAKNEVISSDKREAELNKIINKIKKNGQGNKYDCLIGLSGGVDSSYVAYLAKEYGLRPLAVHLDNGWNSEIAVKNIENIITKTGFDLYTIVVNWEEFRDIQLSYLKASVVDIEVISDHAIVATMYKLAKKYNIRYILAGTNVVTEAILPRTWIYDKGDLRNLKDIHNKYGKIKLKTYPTLGFLSRLYSTILLNIEFISILNYVDYNKVKAKETLLKELNWRDYGGKHYESTFTKFYQAYILPTKFNIDKRKAHLSTLICSNQITRKEALAELAKPLYTEKEIEQDLSYVLKKFGLTMSEWDDIMKMERKPHTAFKNDASLRRNYFKFLNKTYSVRLFVKKLLHKEFA